ncbi:MAG TPA: lytic murein transglycosylase B, partial [Steroidobacteraceae bacterium]|nr:lytic murein transglycosylase B [Steroidobacteraceae bacterium]
GLLCTGLLRAPGVCATAHGFDLSRPEIQSFIATAARQPPLTRAAVTRILRHARPDPGVIDKISRPAETVLPWWQYRANFVTGPRIDEGVRFWLAHRAVLEDVSRDQGVAPEYIVAILGCETAYGRITGKDRVLDSLATLAFDYPQRGDFFRGELLQFLLLAREAHLNPRTVKGSYTGAMGAPQFMPSSYRRYGVDADANHHIDLWNDWSDIFASVANLLKVNGWQSGAPVLAEAHLAPGAAAPELPQHLDLTQTLAGLEAIGITTDSDLPGTTPAVLIGAEQQSGPAYRVGFNNFYVISRYNRSARYSMAVADLAQAIAAGVRSP